MQNSHPDQGRHDDGARTALPNFTNLADLLLSAQRTDDPDRALAGADVISAANRRAQLRARQASDKEFDNTPLSADPRAVVRVLVADHGADCVSKWAQEVGNTREPDNDGRPYAKLSELRAGMFVQVDGGFASEGVQEIEPWSIVEVKAFTAEECPENPGTLYIDCVHKGEVAPHPLEIQGDFQPGGDDDNLIGVYLITLPSPRGSDATGAA